VAARRLIAVLVVLFAISIAAAAVAPERRSSTAADEEATSATESEAPPAGGSVSVTVEASTADPPTARASVGDQLELTVSAQSLLQVEIPALGLLEEAEPGAPARFDILLRQPGNLEITDAAERGTLGRILVSDGGASGGSEPAPDDEDARTDTLESTNGERPRNR